MRAQAFPEIRGMEAFAAVMATGSLTAAARVLDCSQPTVTRLIQDLESNLGFPVLIRNGPRIAPTRQGSLFHQEVERVLTGLQQVRERADSIANDRVRAVEIVASPSLAVGLVPAALALLPPELLPQHVHLRSAPADDVARSVLSRSADLGLASLPLNHVGLDVHWLAELPCVAVLREDDPLAAEPVIALARLTGQRVATAAGPYGLRHRLERALAAAGAAPAVVIDTNATVNALGCARAGLALAVVESASLLDLPMPGLAIRKLDAAIPYFWGVVTPAAMPVSETVHALVRAIERVATERMPGFRLHQPGDGAAREWLADPHAELETR